MNPKLIGRTWLSPTVPGPWAVDNSNPTRWGIIHTESGATKVIGPVCKPRQRKGTKNYFDVALAEADRRNQALINDQLVAAAPATAQEA